jgi:hypothetical protein
MLFASPLSSLASKSAHTSPIGDHRALIPDFSTGLGLLFQTFPQS